MRAVETFGKVDADGSQAELRHVETYARAVIPVECPIRRVPGYPIGVGIQQRVGSSNMVVKLVDEDGERYSAVERDGLAQFDLPEIRVGRVKDRVVTAHLLVGKRKERARRN